MVQTTEVFDGSQEKFGKQNSWQRCVNEQKRR